MKVNKTMIAVILALLLAAPVTVMLADAAPTRNANSPSGNTYDCGNAVDTMYFTIKFYEYTGTSTSKVISITDDNRDDFTEVASPLKSPARILYEESETDKETIAQHRVTIPQHYQWNEGSSWTNNHGYYEWVNEWSQGHYEERYLTSNNYTTQNVLNNLASSRSYNLWVENIEDEWTYGHYVFHEGDAYGRYTTVNQTSVMAPAHDEPYMEGAGTATRNNLYMIIEGTDNNTSIRLTPTYSIAGTPEAEYTCTLTLGDEAVTSGQTLTNLDFDVAYAMSISLTHKSLTTHLSSCTPTLTLIISAQNYESGTGKNTGNAGDVTNMAFRTHLQLFRDELVDLNSGPGQIFSSTDTRNLKANITDNVGLYVESQNSGRDRHFMTTINANQSSTTVSFALTVPNTPFYIKTSAYFGNLTFSITYKDGNVTRTTNQISFDDANQRNWNPYHWSDHATGYLGVTENDGQYTLVLYTNEADARAHAVDIDGEVILNVTAHDMCSRWDNGMNRCELNVNIGNDSYRAGVTNMELIPLL